jgi:hypothetical protein
LVRKIFHTVASLPLPHNAFILGTAPPLPREKKARALSLRSLSLRPPPPPPSLPASSLPKPRSARAGTAWILAATRGRDLARQPWTTRDPRSPAGAAAARLARPDLGAFPSLILSSVVVVAIPPVDLPASLLFEGRSKKTVLFDVIS